MVCPEFQKQYFSEAGSKIREIVLHVKEPTKQSRSCHLNIKSTFFDENRRQTMNFKTKFNEIGDFLSNLPAKFHETETFT